MKALAISMALYAMFGLSAAAAPGWPSRDPQLDALPGFQNPPAGYGEVPFWWWSGEELDADRLVWQVRELHKKGISGVQVNYSHLDTPGWATDFKDPAIFTDAWWKIYSRVAEECGKLDMGIGLSTYTLDWPKGGNNLFLDLFYSKPELNALEIRGEECKRLKGGDTMRLAVSAERIGVRAYAVKGGKLQRGGIDLSASVKNGQLVWTAPKGEWSVWKFESRRKNGRAEQLFGRGTLPENVYAFKAGGKRGS